MRLRTVTTTVLAVSLLAAGCTASRNQTRSADLLQPSRSGKLKLQGTVTINSVAMGTQTANFSLLYAELYGTRVEVLGPAGPLLFASVNPNTFEAYSVPERALIRDDIAPVLQKSERSSLSLVTVMLGAIASYLSNFGETALFQKPENTRYGLKYTGMGPLEDITLRWYDRAVPKDEADGQTLIGPGRTLEQIVVDTGYSFVYADRTDNNGFRIHFGDQTPLLEIDIQLMETQFQIQGIQWQLLVPPGSDVFTFAQYLSRQR